MISGLQDATEASGTPTFCSRVPAEPRSAWKSQDLHGEFVVWRGPKGQPGWELPFQFLEKMHDRAQEETDLRVPRAVNVGLTVYRAHASQFS